jgi:hypothetical protein
MLPGARTASKGGGEAHLGVAEQGGAVRKHQPGVRRRHVQEWQPRRRGIGCVVVGPRRGGRSDGDDGGGRAGGVGVAWTVEAKQRVTGAARTAVPSGFAATFSPIATSPTTMTAPAGGVGGARRVGFRRGLIILGAKSDPAGCHYRWLLG